VLNGHDARPSAAGIAVGSRHGSHRQSRRGWFSRKRSSTWRISGGWRGSYSRSRLNRATFGTDFVATCLVIWLTPDEGPGGVALPAGTPLTRISHLGWTADAARLHVTPSSISYR